MELRHLRYFVMAAEEANISRAAARLRVSQPAVSRQIRDLETEWDVMLFDREPQGLRLTAAGEVALGPARDVLRQAQALGETLQPFRQTGQRKTIRVGFIPTALPGLLTQGLRHFRRTDLCIQISEMHPAAQIAALRREEIDLALPGAAGRQVQAEFFTRALRTTPLAMVVPADHPLAARASVRLAEFGADPFLSLSEERFPGRAKMEQRLFADAGITPVVALTATGLNELLGLVGAGAGVALVPADLDRLQSSGVKFLKLQRPQMKFHSAAVWRDSRRRLEVESLVEVLATAEPSA